MTGILFNVQHAIMAALMESAEVQAVFGASPPIYNHVPPDAAFPYIAFGKARLDACDTLSDSGFEHLITLDIYSRYRGGKEAQDIFQAVYSALHRRGLEVPGQSFVPCEFSSADFETLADGLTSHAAARFRIQTREA